jgi:Zn finger protein HypA/HybF involved in hydrogenase expression
MHDFLLAKEIIDELKKIAVEKNIENIKKVDLEIGSISLAHDGFDEHTEDISIENLEFGLKNISKNTPFENTEFEIKKTEGNHWKITNIEV